VLNSTLFAFERYTAAKSLGREAAIDIEVFTPEALRIPDLRSFSADQIDQLRTAANTLIAERPSPALDEPLMELGKSAAFDFISRTPVGRDAWPKFMTSPSRTAIDSVLLLGIGVQPSAVDQVRENLCNELLQYTRKLKVLEFQAQENRRGASNSSLSPKDIADEALQQILSDRQLTLRRMPLDFIPENAECQAFFIPAPGKLVIIEPDLFSGMLRGRIRGHDVVFDNPSQAALVGLLSKYGLSGTFNLPIRPVDSEATRSAIESYMSLFEDELDYAAAAVSSDVDYQARILKQGMNVVLHHE
jgi:hypothetical protein